MSTSTEMRFMADIPRVQAQARAEHAALVCESQTVSYAELELRSNQCAQALLATGLGRQARVAILDFNSSAYLEVFFAAAKLDCATVGVNARLAAPEVAFILEDSSAAVLFVGREHYRLIESIESQLTTAPLIIALEGGHARWPALRDWCAAHPAKDPHVQLYDDSDVIQLYTSGTTGHPKGVCHTNRTWRLLAQAGRAAQWGDYGRDTVNFVCLPLFHVAGFNLACLALLGGGTALLTRKLDVDEILRFIPHYRVTDTLFVPAVILAIVSHPQAPGTDFSSLRCISYGAAPIAEDLLRRARAMFDCAFVHLYGLTENLGAGTFLPAEMHDPALGKLRSCGRAYPGLDIKIIDSQGTELPAGEVGEILLRCEWVMRSYWRNALATAAAVQGGWLHTGDAGYLDADGFLYIHDRVKDMIVTGGENVYPAEVENALFGHPSIADVAVIGVPDEKWGEAVKALVVLKPGRALDAQSILDFARQRIAGYKLPKSIEVLGALPRNASGKVLRRELREPFWRGQARRVS